MRGVNLNYFARRIGMFFLVIIVAASFNFLIPRLAPGNPIGAITSRMANASAGIENGQAMFEAQAIEISLQAGSMMGVEKEERVATPWYHSLKLRHPWLQLNLVTAFLAAVRG